VSKAGDARQLDRAAEYTSPEVRETRNAGESVGVTNGDDTLQLGADVVVDQEGRIA